MNGPLSSPGKLPRKMVPASRRRLPLVRGNRRDATARWRRPQSSRRCRSSRTAFARQREPVQLLHLAGRLGALRTPEARECRADANRRRPSGNANADWGLDNFARPPRWMTSKSAGSAVDIAWRSAAYASGRRDHHRMGQRFREITHRVCVPPLIAVGGGAGAGLFSVKQRRLVPDSVRFGWRAGSIGRGGRRRIGRRGRTLWRGASTRPMPNGAPAARGASSTGLSEKLPAICEGGRRRIMAWPLFSSDDFQGKGPTYTLEDAHCVSQDHRDWW